VKEYNTVVWTKNSHHKSPSAYITLNLDCSIKWRSNIAETALLTRRFYVGYENYTNWRFNHSSPGQCTNLGYCLITRHAVSYLSFKGLCPLIRGTNPPCCASYREACIFDFNRNFIGFPFFESDTTPDTRREFNDLRVMHIPRKSRIILIKRHHVSLSDNRFVYRMRYNLEMHIH